MEKNKVFKVTSFVNVSCEGTIILRGDSTFEGIVTTGGEDSLITGSLVDLGAVFIKFSKPGILPYSFYGHSVGVSVIGKWTSHDSFSAHDEGTGEIIFKEIPLEDVVVKDISERIEGFKKDMDRFSAEMYEDYVKCMDATVKELVANINLNKASIEKEIGEPLKNLEY